MNTPRKKTSKSKPKMTIRSRASQHGGRKSVEEKRAELEDAVSSSDERMLDAVNSYFEKTIGKRPVKNVTSHVHFDDEEKEDEITSEKTVQTSVRLSNRLLKEISIQAQTSGLSQQEWMRRQFESAIVDQEAKIPAGVSPPASVSHEGLSTSGKISKKQMNVRLEPTLFQAVIEASEEADVRRNDWLRAAVVKALRDGLDVVAELEPYQATQDDPLTNDP